MKKIIFTLCCFFAAISVNAEMMEVPFEPEEFDVNIFQFPHMVLIENKKSEQLNPRYTFTDAESSYQIRYAFFKQTTRDYADIRAVYAMFAMFITFNVAGFETDQILNFNDSDVQNEFNGDFGSTVFLMNPKSSFSEGYNYIMLNFYYKNNQGIVVQATLFNDLNFIENKNFDEIFHSFEFHE